MHLSLTTDWVAGTGYFTDTGVRYERWLFCVINISDADTLVVPQTLGLLYLDRCVSNNQLPELTGQCNGLMQDRCRISSSSDNDGYLTSFYFYDDNDRLALPELLYSLHHRGDGLLALSTRLSFRVRAHGTSTKRSTGDPQVVERYQVVFGYR